jgi:hypothetical protein
MWRHKTAIFLHTSATVVSICNLLAILYIHRATLLTGKGLGSFVAPWFVMYFVATFFLWGVAVLLEKNRFWSRVYWSSILFMIALMAVVPMQFYID